MTQTRLTRRTFLAASAAAGLGSQPVQAQAADSVTIALSSSSLGAAAPRIAQDLRLFAARRIDARLVVMDSGAAAVAALVSGSAQFAYAGPGEAIAARARGQQIVTIANGYAGLAGSLVLSKGVAASLKVATDASVAERLKALDGILIASPSAASAYTVAFRIATAGQGATPRFTYMAQPAMGAALEAGAVQGFIAGAPFWAGPTLRGTGVTWISGPKGELPTQASPASSVSLLTLQSFAQANRDLMARAAGVFADLGKRIDEAPGDVKAAVARLYPDVDAATLDILFASEARGWRAKPLTPDDMAREIAFVKAGGGQIPGLDAIHPADMVFRI